MDESIQILLIVVAIIVAIIIAISIIVSKVNKKVMNTMFDNVYKVLKNIQENIDGDSRILRCYTKTHDYYFETPTKKYYIKIVNNPGNHEICVNNALKWQLRKSLGDDRMYFVEGIEPLMRMEIEPSPKETKKIYIIYPNARSLLKYINECEMIFINPTTDVYGTNIITYADFSENYEELNF